MLAPMRANLRVALPDGTLTDIEGPDMPDWDAAMTATREKVPEGAVLNAWINPTWGLE